MRDSWLGAKVLGWVSNEGMSHFDYKLGACVDTRSTSFWTLILAGQCRLLISRHGWCCADAQKRLYSAIWNIMLCSLLKKDMKDPVACEWKAERAPETELYILRLM